MVTASYRRGGESSFNENKSKRSKRQSLSLLTVSVVGVTLVLTSISLFPVLSARLSPFGVIEARKLNPESFHHHTPLYKQFFRLWFWAQTVVSFNKPKRYMEFDKHYPTREISGSSTPFTFTISDKPFELPTTFTHDKKGENYSVRKFLKSSGAVSLLIVHNGEIRFEEYYRHRKASDRHILFSISKLITMTALATAYHDGLFNSVNDVLSDLVPELEGTIFEGLPIVNFLQMSTAAEEDSIPAVSRLISGKSITQYTIDAQKDENEVAGETWSYAQPNIQAMAMLVMALVGPGYASFTEYVQEKVWNPLGMQDPASYVLDDEGTEHAWFGLSASARDLAKLGQLYLDNGVNFSGTQMVDPVWVTNVSKSDANTPLQRGFSGTGYGYNMYLPPHRGLGFDDFYGLGANAQFLYVNPANNTVIVKLSAGGILGDGGNYPDHIDLFRTISSQL